MSKAFRTKYLFQKYLLNSCSVAEMEELFALLEEDDNFETIEHSLSDLWEISKNEQQQIPSLMFEKFQQKVAEQKQAYSYPKKKTNLYRWAAAACIVCCLSFLGHYFYTAQNPVLVTASEKLSSSEIHRGLKRIVLSDGSTVILNKGSYLNYPEKFGANKREVYLTGEGFFDIKHDAKRPFLVHSGKITTRVLGTAFNIKTGPQDQLVEVTVVRGKVGVADPKKTVAVLLPNQKVSYDVLAKKYRKENVNARLTTLWKEEDLVLDNIPMEKAVEIIAERYATTIHLGNKEIRNCRFTAYFLNTTSLEQVLKVISNLNHISYQGNEQGGYTLSGQGCE